MDEYNTDELDTGAGSDEDGVEKTKFPTFKMRDKTVDYNWSLVFFFGSNSEVQEAMRTYVI